MLCLWGCGWRGCISLVLVFAIWTLIWLLLIIILKLQIFPTHKLMIKKIVQFYNSPKSLWQISQTIVFLFVFSRWDIHNHTWPIAEALRPAVVNLDFQRGGETLFRATNFAGYVGIITAIKPVRKWEHWKFVPTIRCNFIVMHKSYLFAINSGVTLGCWIEMAHSRSHSPSFA